MHYHFQSSAYPNVLGTLRYDLSKRLFTFEAPERLLGLSVATLCQASMYLLGLDVFGPLPPDDLWTHEAVPEVSVQYKNTGSVEIKMETKDGPLETFTFFNIMTQPPATWTDANLDSFFRRPGRITGQFAVDPVMREIVFVKYQDVQRVFRCSFEHPIVPNTLCGPYVLKENLLKWNPTYRGQMETAMSKVKPQQQRMAKKRAASKRCRVTPQPSPLYPPEKDDETGISDSESGSFLMQEARTLVDQLEVEEAAAKHAFDIHSKAAKAASLR